MGKNTRAVYLGCCFVWLTIHDKQLRRKIERVKKVTYISTNIVIAAMKVEMCMNGCAAKTVFRIELQRRI